MTDTTLTAAIKEAYASAPNNVVIYHTIELIHPAFLNSLGAAAPIRVVKDYQDLVSATLEITSTTAPLTAVTFTAFNFEFTKPEISPTGVPQITLKIDNVDRSISANIELAMATTDLITVIYREFISTDLSAPQNNPPLSMTIMSINVDVFSVTATAGFPNLMNKRFPTTEYSVDIFSGLAT
jgi:hypothetical protein